MIKAVIIDDERSSRELLRNMLTNFMDGVSVIGEAFDVKSGIELIKKTLPELVFLDIEMPGGNGFEIIKAFDEFPAKVIFVTGYDHYAIRALRCSALDYLLKPLNLTELENAIERFETLKYNQNTNLKFLEEIRTKNTTKIDRLILSDSNGHSVLEFGNIIKIEAKTGYVIFYLVNNETKIGTFSLNYYEELLPPNVFHRIHRSYIVNCTKVINIEGGRGGKAHLEDGSSLKIALRRKAAFIRNFNQLDQKK